MASLTDIVSIAMMAVAKIARKFQGLCRGVLKRGKVADVETTEPERDFEKMESNGVRKRRETEPTSENADDHADSPTTSPTSGTLTPSTSEGPLETRDSFITAGWQRLSDRLGTSLFSQTSTEERRLFNQERGYDKIKEDKLDEYAKGFPQLAALVSCDDDLSMHRSFKYCHNRVLLHLEVEITELEKDLLKLDKEDEADPKKTHRLKRTKHEEGWDTEKKDLFEKLKAKLKEYCDISRNQVFLQALGKPPERNYRSYFNWIWTNKPLARGYYDYMFHGPDFVNMSGKRPNYSEEVIRDFMTWWPRFPLKTVLKEKKEEMKPTADSRVTKFSSTRIGVLGRALLVCTIMTVLMVPVFLLFLVPMSRLLMTVTSTGFILLFALILSVVTDGRVYEVFVGTATIHQAAEKAETQEPVERVAVMARSQSR